jgi:thiol-disulfide isomerase/thioredoxin
MEDVIKLAIVILLTLVLVICVVRYMSKPTNMTMVLFYADWCGACQTIKPTWNELKTELGDVTFEEINEKDTALFEAKQQEYATEVMGFPTMLIINNGEIEKYQGSRDKESIKAHIRSL